MAQAPEFGLTVSQEVHLAPEEQEMHAILGLTATVTEKVAGAGPAVVAPELAQVIVIDRSSSMDTPRTKMVAAIRATRTAIDLLPDGTRFAVVAGDERATMVYPREPELAVASPGTRAAAREAVAGLRANGSTAIGVWLRLTRQLLARYPDAVRHAILLTDGQNTSSRDVLEEELVACPPVFTCDSRGIGEHWEPRELRRIAEALHGTADAVREHRDLSEEFRAMTLSAVGKLVPQVRVVVRTTTGVTVDFLRQTHPTLYVLEPAPVSDRVTAFATGSWGVQTRDFHLCLRTDRVAAELDERIRIARVDVQRRRPGSDEYEDLCAGGVFACWTNDARLSSVIDPRVAHYTDQAALGENIRLGIAAYRIDDLETAEAEWRSAVLLAAESGNEKALARLRRLVRITGDPRDGVISIRDDIGVVDLLWAEMGSSTTTRGPVDTPSADRPATPGPNGECPICGTRWSAAARYCGDCQHELVEPH